MGEGETGISELCGKGGRVGLGPDVPLQSAYPTRAFAHGDVLRLMDCKPLFELEKKVVLFV
jgi:hypothetical protein